jgi:hypothetical protein
LGLTEIDIGKTLLIAICGVVLVFFCGILQIRLQKREAELLAAKAREQRLHGRIDQLERMFLKIYRPQESNQQELNKVS